MKTLYAMVGTPGVGKTTFLKETSMKIFGNETLMRYVVGPDTVRTIVQSPHQKADGSYGISQENEGFVWKFINEILDKKVEKGETIIVDATHSRNKAISNYKKYSDQGYRIVLVDFSDYATLEEIYERNEQRDYYKFVPPLVIETMYERIKNLDIPGWVEVIKPDEFVDHIQNVKFNFDHFKAVHFIGDIHGCYNEFQDLLIDMKINQEVVNKEEALIFIGDYFDRGRNPVEVFRLMQKLDKNYWVLPLTGNHEEPLRFYKDFIQEIYLETIQWIKSTVDLPRVKHRPEQEGIGIRIKQFLQKFYKDAETTVEPEHKYPLEAYKACTYFKQKSYKQLDTFIEEIKKWPDLFASYEAFINQYRFPDDLNHIKRTSRTTMKRFLLSDVKYTEVAAFYKRLAQLCYVDYHDNILCATHGGLPDLPTKFTPTSDMIRGVGTYEDSLLCDETFTKLAPENAFSIHGHRNMTNIPVQSTEKTFNINGDVELGLRAVTFTQQAFQTFEVEPREDTLEYYKQNQLHRAKDLNENIANISEESALFMELFHEHPYVKITRQPNDIAAINFTSKAFHKGIWDKVTVKARGLFTNMDKNNKPTDKVIARGYQKFFNLGERAGFDKKDVRELAFPIRAYEKANGYLGILSVDDRDPEHPIWFTSSKSTTVGEYADNFRTLVYPVLTPVLMEKVKEAGVTLLFEVVDPVFDPHIQEYTKKSLVLLDVVKNQLNFEREPYENLEQYIDKMNQSFTTVRVKKLVQECKTFNDWHLLVEEANAVSVLSEIGIEGYVFEDVSDPTNMFKLKTNWYSFWKKTRSNRDRIIRQLEKIYKNNPHEQAKLSKSQLIKHKANLHHVEEIKVFNALVKICEKDFRVAKNMSVIELRKEILADLDDLDSIKNNE